MFIIIDTDIPVNLVPREAQAKRYTGRAVSAHIRDLQREQVSSGEMSSPCTVAAWVMCPLNLLGLRMT